MIFLSLNKEKDSDVLLGGVQEKWKRDATSILASMGEAAPACIFLRSADMAPALATTSPLKILSVVVCVLAGGCLLGFLGAFVVPALKTFVLPTVRMLVCCMQAFPLHHQRGCCRTLLCIPASPRRMHTGSAT